MKKKHIIRFTLYVAKHCEMLDNGTTGLLREPFSDTCGVDFSGYLADKEVIKGVANALRCYLEAYILDKYMDSDLIPSDSKLHYMLKYIDTWDNHLLEPIKKYFDELLDMYNNNASVGEC